MLGRTRPHRRPQCFVPTGATLPAILALADGTVFVGKSIGATGITTGEVVFNTAMTGYQGNSLIRSYCRQLVTLTYPHIGKHGRQRRGMLRPMLSTRLV